MTDITLRKVEMSRERDIKLEIKEVEAKIEEYWYLLETEPEEDNDWLQDEIISLEVELQDLKKNCCSCKGTAIK